MMRNNKLFPKLTDTQISDLPVCNQYPVRKLIQVGDTIEVIYLYKDPVN